MGVEGFYSVQWHLNLHSKNFHISEKTKYLDCPICSGLPPWEWGELGMDVYVEVWPFGITSWGRKKNIYGTPSPDAYDQSLNKYGYGIYYLAFGWRKLRLWGVSKVPIGLCRVCQKVRRVAAHKLRNYNQSNNPMRDWEETCICLKCVKKENRRKPSPKDKEEVTQMVKKLISRGV